MKVYKLSEMVKGWFVGNFHPVAFKTPDVEVAVKRYLKGDSEVAHYHKLATEITVIVSGNVLMNDVVYKDGDILVINPNTAIDFLALSDVITTVIKIPGAENDKYIGLPSKN